MLLRRKPKRFCKNCNKLLPPTNWQYCSKCKKELIENKEEDFPYQSAYSTYITIDHLKYI